MRFGAGPRKFLGAANDLRAHGIAFDVSHGGPKMRFVERAGEKSALPEMPGFSAAFVDGGGKSRVRVAKATSQRIGMARHDDPMNVVGHQAVGPNINPMFFAVALKKSEIQSSRVVIVKDAKPTIAVLSDMMRNAGHDDTGETSHVKGSVEAS